MQAATEGKTSGEEETREKREGGKKQTDGGDAKRTRGGPKSAGIGGEKRLVWNREKDFHLSNTQG